MASKPGIDVLNLGHIVTLESSLSATTTSKRPAVSEPAPIFVRQTCSTALATTSNAAQSSELYVMSFAFISGPLSCSHSFRHTMDCTPEESRSDHLNPNQPAFSFSPFE